LIEAYDCFTHVQVMHNQPHEQERKLRRLTLMQKIFEKLHLMFEPLQSEMDFLVNHLRKYTSRDYKMCNRLKQTLINN